VLIFVDVTLPIRKNFTRPVNRQAKDILTASGCTVSHARLPGGRVLFLSSLKRRRPCCTAPDYSHLLFDI